MLLQKPVNREAPGTKKIKQQNNQPNKQKTPTQTEEQRAKAGYLTCYD